MRQGRIHYAWVIVGVTFAVTLVTAALRAVPGVLIVPLEEHFHWSRATISAAIALNLLVLGALGPFGAAILDRFGLRRVVVASLLLVATGMAMTAFITEAWQLMLLWGVVVAIGAANTFMILAATVAARWFDRRRGLVMGLLTASTATGQLIFLPVLAGVNQSLGWQAVLFTAAGLTAAVAIPVAFLMRDHPADIGLLPYGAVAGSAPRIRPTGNPFLRAIHALKIGLRHRDFYLIAGSFFVCGASTNGLIGTHLIAACVDQGIPAVTGASLMAGMGLFNIFGSTASGWLSDRYDSRVLLSWYYGLRGLSLLALPFAFHTSVWGLSAFALFYGLDWVATVPPTVRLTARAFGEQNVAIYYGWITAVHQIGGASIAWFAGVLRVDTGDYFSAFMISGVLCLVASIGVSFIGRQPDRLLERPVEA